jgi:ATP-dependent Clp protease ATP-binding subunit ClpC
LQKFIEDPLSEALIQGVLPRPGELEVYLGDTGIFYRPINAEAQPVGAGAEAEPVAGTPLYTF